MKTVLFGIESLIFNSEKQWRGKHQLFKRVFGIFITLLITNSVTIPLVEAKGSKSPFDPQSKAIFLRQLKGQNKKRVVDVGARLILPERSKALGFRAKWSLVYVQFSQPVKGKERSDLAKQKVFIQQYVSNNTYLTRVHQSGFKVLRDHPDILGWEPVEPADKMTRAVYNNEVGPWVATEDGLLKIHVRFFPNVSLGSALSELRKNGITVVKNPEKMLFNNRLLVHASNEQIIVLAESLLVRNVEEIPAPPQTENSTSAILSNVDLLKQDPYNLDGNDVLVGIWDGGPVLATHQDLTPRVIIRENDEDLSDHATHVAGTIMSSGANNSAAEGMAPMATLYSWDFGDDTATEQLAAVVADSIEISNHSWGPITGWFQNDDDIWVDQGNSATFGTYNGRAFDYDTLVQSTALIITKSAGNDHGDCDFTNVPDADPANPGDPCDGVVGGDGRRYDLVAGFGVSKNVISVGAINDDGVTITPFSSSGPADDGRIKPDVVANGRSLTSTCSDSDSDYCSKSGTSMSAPSVAGAAALLVEHYQNENEGITPSPDIIKALFVNTAQDLGRPGPDYIFGHGLIDAQAAAQIIDADDVRIITGELDQDDADEYVILVNGDLPELRVTLNWIDPPGVTGVNTIPDIVNNLDVELVGPDGTVYFPFTGPQTSFTGLATANGPNTIDTVEHVLVANPDQGVWSVRVIGTGVPVGPQNYALIANASFSLPDQPDIRVNAPLDFVDTCVGDQIDLSVTIFNIGGANLDVNEVVVDGNPNFTVLPNPTQPVIIAPGAHLDFTVRYTPDTAGISEIATLQILSNDADEGFLELPITGTVGEPSIVATLEADGDFGDVLLGSLGVLNLDILNEGTCDLEIQDVFRSSGSADFEVGSLPAGVDFPIIIGPGSNFDMPVHFSPTSFTSQSATIRVLSDSTAVDFIVTGRSSPPDIEISGDLSFGTLCVSENNERTIQVCNVGVLNTLVVTSASLNPECDDFEIVGNPFPADVSHDFCIPLTVKYTPTEAGVHSCTLTIDSNDPDEPSVSIDVTGETPLSSIASLADLAFTPTVIQSVGPGEASQPLTIVNNGQCPVTITDVVLDQGVDYSLSGLPALPVTLAPGEQLGDGALEAVFRPNPLQREVMDTLTVTYIQDPSSGATALETAKLCGEGVRTGARILVTKDGVPFDEVERIQIQRINANRNKDRLETIDNARKLPLRSYDAAEPCEDFQYHQEYGTVDNPVQLLPGDYQVTVTVLDNRRRGRKSVGFSVEVTDFVDTIEVQF